MVFFELRKKFRPLWISIVNVIHPHQHKDLDSVRLAEIDHNLQRIEDLVMKILSSVCQNETPVFA